MIRTALYRKIMNNFKACQAFYDQIVLTEEDHELREEYKKLLLDVLPQAEKEYQDLCVLGEEDRYYTPRIIEARKRLINSIEKT